MVVDAPVLIDTNIWIDVLGGVPDAKLVLDNHIDIAMSAISFAEVASGCEPDELAMFEAFVEAGRGANPASDPHKRPDHQTGGGIQQESGDWPGAWQKTLA